MNILKGKEQRIIVWESERKYNSNLGKCVVDFLRFKIF